MKYIKNLIMVAGLMILVVSLSGFKWPKVISKFFSDDIQAKALKHPWKEHTFQEYGFRIKLPDSQIQEDQIPSFAGCTEHVRSNRIYETPNIWGCVYRIEASEYDLNMSGTEQMSCMEETAQLTITALKEQSNGELTLFPPLTDTFRYWFDPVRKVSTERSLDGPVVRGLVLRNNASSLLYNLTYICDDYLSHNKTLRRRFLDSFTYIGFVPGLTSKSSEFDEQ